MEMVGMKGNLEEVKEKEEKWKEDKWEHMQRSRWEKSKETKKLNEENWLEKWDLVGECRAGETAGSLGRV